MDSCYDEIVELIDKDEFTEDPVNAYENKIYAKGAPVKTAVPYLDTYLMDIKHMNPEKHKEYTGHDNIRMLENALRVAHSGQTDPHIALS